MKKKILNYILILAVLISTFNILLPTKVLAAAGNDIVAEGKKHLGKPYVFGSTGPNSFDCSGFVQYVYKQFNIDLPRTTYSQINVGSEVSRDQLIPGDIIFTSSSHVGIYVGNNQMIHAPQSKDVVKISTIWSFYKARRVAQVSNFQNEQLERSLFDAHFYADKYPDLKNAFGYDQDKLFNHWMTSGINEGRSSSTNFDLSYYLHSNPDLVAAFGGSNYRQAYNHYIISGHSEGRKTALLL